jgi:hypothetical protein
MFGAPSLEDLTQQFNADTSTKSSSIALKNIFKSIVLSKTFNAHQANRETCYDRRVGDTTENATPCKVAAVLAKNCVKCHGSTDDSGHLDLSHWKSHAGSSFGFPHLGENGKAIDPKITFQSMLDRLGASDPELRMPYRMDMPSQERETLYHWLNAQLNKSREMGEP